MGIIVKLVTIIVAIISIAVHAYCAYLMQHSMILKGYGKDLHAWAICFWLGILGYFYLLSLPDKIQQSQNQQMIDQNQQMIKLLRVMIKLLKVQEKN